MNVTELERMTLRLTEIERVANTATLSIAGSPESWLDDLLAKIVAALNTIRDSIVNSIIGALGGIWDNVDRIIKAVEGFASAITDKIQSIVDGFVSKLQTFIDGFVSTVQTFINNALSYLKGVVEDIVTFWGNFAGEIIEWLGGVIEKIKGWAKEMADKITQTLGNVITTVGNWVKETIEKIKEFASGVAEAIKSTGQSVIEKVTGVLRDIWDKIKQTLLNLYNKVVAAGEYIRDKVIPFLSTVYTDTREGLAERLEGAKMLVEGMAAGNGNAIVTGIQKVISYREPTDITSLFAAAMTVQAVAPQGIAASLQGPLKYMAQKSLEGVPVGPLDPGALGEAVAKGILPPGAGAKQLAQQGIVPEYINILAEVARPLPPPGAIQEAYVRGLITEEKHDGLLKRAGYRDEDIRLFKSLYWVIPPLSDIIRMAVREAFSPDVAKKFGQYEDLPKEFVTWAEKQGLSKEWAERYWAAHWDLPSPQMGFEMLHRRIITEEELKLLLRALDVMPFWREKLIQLSYNPYTRVDLRRMYTLGILSEEDVFNAYLDLGYDKERAKNLTEFTVKYYAPEEETEVDRYRKLAQSVYLRAFKKGLLAEEQTIENLKQIGYSPEDSAFLVELTKAEMQVEGPDEKAIPMRSKVTTLAVDAYKRGLYTEEEVTSLLKDLQYSDLEIEWYLALSEYERITAIKNYIVEDVHKRYVERTITKSEAQAELGRVFPYGAELQRLFEVWDIEREARSRKPTEAQFRAALLKGLITPEEYAEELRGLGYPEKYVRMLVSLATGGGRYD